MLPSETETNCKICCTTSVRVIISFETIKVPKISYVIDMPIITHIKKIKILTRACTLMFYMLANTTLHSRGSETKKKLTENIITIVIQVPTK